MRTRKTCHWHEDNEGVWQTECGTAHVFFEGGPTGNNYHFCTYCALPLVAVPYKPKRFKAGVRRTSAGEAGAGGGGGGGTTT